MVRGARAVAGQAFAFAQVAQFARPVLVNGGAGAITTPPGQLLSVMGFTITNGKIVEIDVLADPARLGQIDLTVLGD